ncbi:uncharacterized protein LOC112094643 [Morus notabilis]|uniref:uncharacterized protein LOC112094643 n=1 Tax=Morus notabilis TaxID=981085 RepID=UPI000CED410A|nr:uncharacterized protein LOC112094643 [Morus notabilis]
MAPQRPPVPQFHAMQAQRVFSTPQLNRVEASPQANAHLMTYTKEEAEAGTSNVVTGQLTVAHVPARALFDSGATHTFASVEFVKRILHPQERIRQAFKIALPSGDVLLSSHWLRHVPVEIAGRELSADLVVLNLVDYDVILGMDFLGK